ncbi:MAG TPA: nuclear transport factor 2 family protein [Devosia sp.]|nr:nuclear transport factor 2 family protein [Devosia sp.]
MNAIPDPKHAVAQQLRTFVEMIRSRDTRLIETLWGDGKFVLVGSETGEIFRTLPELRAHLEAILSHAATFFFEFPAPVIEIVGTVAWVFAEGTLTRVEPGADPLTSPYLVCCVFELTGGVWRWRQFFGSEPR